MIVKVADHAGFCFGVKRAVEKTEKFLLDNGEAYIGGDLVHNRSVTERLEDLGLIKYDKMPENSAVIIRSHGESPQTKDKLSNNKNLLIDCTCPVLLNIYDKIKDKYDQGYKILIVGDKDHPEVIALNGYVNNQAIIINSKEEANSIKGLDKLYIISQTTSINEHFNNICQIIKNNNTDCIINNTICNSTRIRQESCKELSSQVEYMIVIGGKNSSNTDKLYKIAKNNCKNAIKIESYEELDFIDFSKYNSIGITAGASTPSWKIEEVIYFMDNYSKDEFMEQIEDSMTKIYPKEIIKGEVIYVTDEEVVVNINYKSDGIVSLNELSNDENVKPKDLFEEDQEIDVYVIKLDDGEGNVVLSTRRVEGLKNWHKIVESYENEELITVNVTKEVKGGLLGNHKGIVAFIPGSQIKSYYIKDLGQFVGEDLECKILSIDEKKRRIVASSRAIEEEQKQKEIDKFWETFEEGDTLQGSVARIVDFGAFVNLGPMDGLVHISDISWNRIKHPSDVLEVGQEVETLVLKKDEEKKQVSLGYKQLQAKPFDEFLENNESGDVVKGEIVNLVDFGAFVRLEEGVEGLVHVSEISHDHVEKPSDELNIGDVIEVKILNIESDDKRIALSIKALEEKPEKPKAKKPDQSKKRPAKAKKQKRSEPVYQEEETNEGLDTSIGALLDFDLEEELDVSTEDSKNQEPNQDNKDESVENEAEDLVEEANEELKETEEEIVDSKSIDSVSEDVEDEGNPDLNESDQEDSIEDEDEDNN